MISFLSRVYSFILFHRGASFHGSEIFYFWLIDILNTFFCLYLKKNDIAVGDCANQKNGKFFVNRSTRITFTTASI